MRMPKKINPENIIHEVIIPNEVIGYWALFYVNGLSYQQYVPGELANPIEYKRVIRHQHGLADDHDIRLVAQFKFNN